MAPTKKEFLRILALHGPDVNTWPEELELQSLRAQRDPALMALIRQQLHSEALLRDRPFLSPNADFADRIIEAAIYNKRHNGWAAQANGWLRELLSVIELPQPAFALVAVLLLGFAIGLSSPLLQSGEEPSVASYVGDEGEIL